METPYQNHINKGDFEHVYEPAEDSFLLIDALEKELTFLKQMKPLYCLEIGSGSGVVITALGMALHDSLYFSTDINFKACLMTKNTAIYNKVLLECVNMCFATCFLDKQFDVVIFNPPYVVTESEECNSNGIEASWAGGLKGREVTDKLLDMIPKILSDAGVFYLLLIEENIPEEVVEIMSNKGYKSELIIKRRVKNENQLVLKFHR
ncbi:methyltransferase N6AMT1 [Zerene cesonia]|uniref:methyltransferase N6AMT1 n=1 Tax=Zerene cesonia TaxID=33412 RepID=UPI0018E587DE|nr:methyltransferase N6AMT1 [Zerene cesonia]